MSDQQITESKTLKEVAEDYIDALVFTETKASTVSVYLKCIQLCVNYFGAQREVASITSAHVGKFFKAPALLNLPNGRPRSEITVKQIRRVFRQCMQFALDKGFISTLPIPRGELEHARAKTPRQDAPEPVAEPTQN